MCLFGIQIFKTGRTSFREGNGTPLQYSCLENPMEGGAWCAAVDEVTKSRTWLSDFTLTFHFHAVEKEMATHSSVLAWRIPGTEEPGRRPSMGSHRVGHDWSDSAAAAAELVLTESVLQWLPLQLDGWQPCSQVTGWPKPYLTDSYHLLSNSGGPTACCCAVLRHSILPDSLRPHGLQPTRLLCAWGFPRQEHWSGLPCPPPGDLPNPGIEPRSTALQEDSLPTEPPGKPKNTGVGSLSLLQRIFATQEWSRCLLHCRRIFFQASYQGSPPSRWTEEPGRLQSMGSQRVGHNWATSVSIIDYLDNCFLEKLRFF